MLDLLNILITFVQKKRARVKEDSVKQNLSIARENNLS